MGIQKKGRGVIYFLQISDSHHLQQQESNPDNFKDCLSAMPPLEKKLEKLSKRLEKQEISLDFILHCGDMCHNGSVEDYRQVQSLFETYFPQVPLLLTVGNHDTFSAMEEVFADSQTTLLGFTRFFSDLQVISVHSCNGESGELNEAQVSWVQENINAYHDKQHLLFTHHHFIQKQSPMPCGKLCPSAMKLFQSGQISAFLTGHTHYFYQDILEKTPYYGVSSLSFQGTDSGEGFLNMKESGGYNLFSFENKAITLVEQGDLGFEKQLPKSYF